MIPLSKNQIQNAYKCFKQNKYNQPYSENRESHKKISKKLEQLKNHIANKKSYFTIRTLRNEFVDRFPEFEVSYQTVHRAVKYELNYKFKTLPINPKLKNSEVIKRYGFWFVHFVFQSLENEDMVISIDESRFSFYEMTRNSWIQKDTKILFDDDLSTNSTNLSLLLACSQERVIAYYIVEGSVDSIFYCDFLEQINQMLKNTYPSRKIKYIIGNSRIHQSEIVYSLIRRNEMRVIFTPAYSQEIHFIEFVFQKIKSLFVKQY